MSTQTPTGTVVGDAGPGTLSASGYPVNLSVPHPVSPSRFFAIPLLGILARYIMLIPHFIALYIVQAIAGVVAIVASFPVLFTGKYPSGMYDITSGYVRWQAHLGCYMFGLTDKYPPFGFGLDPSYPVQVTFERPEHSSRFFAIPLLGGFARFVLLIPHFIVLYIVAAVAMLLNLVAWIPVLFAGRYPGWQYSFQSGLIRWYARVMAYMFGLTDKYPPFGLGA